MITSFPRKCWVSVYFQHRQLVRQCILKRRDPFNSPTFPEKRSLFFSLSLSAPSPSQLVDLGVSFDLQCQDWSLRWQRLPGWRRDLATPGPAGSGWWYP